MTANRTFIDPVLDSIDVFLACLKGGSLASF